MKTLRQTFIGTLVLLLAAQWASAGVANFWLELAESCSKTCCAKKAPEPVTPDCCHKTDASQHVSTAPADANCTCHWTTASEPQPQHPALLSGQDVPSSNALFPPALTQYRVLSAFHAFPVREKALPSRQSAPTQARIQSFLL